MIRTHRVRPCIIKVADNKRPEGHLWLNSFVRRPLSCLFVLVCTFGFLYQIINLTDIYFAYETTSEVILHLPAILVAPDLSICLRYIDIFDYERYNRNANKSLFKDAYPDNVMKSMFTLDEISDYTPSVSDFLDECKIRLPHSFEMRYTKRAGCNEFFKVTKFYLQEYMCYWVGLVHGKDSPKEYYSYDQDLVATSLFLPTVFYQLVLRTKFISLTQHLKAILHLYPNYPTVSCAYAPVINRRASTDNKSEPVNSFRLTYSSVDITSLPAPYPTACLDYRSLGTKISDRNHCFNHCLSNRTYYDLNRRPFSAIGIKPRPEKHLNAVDFSNSSVSEIYRKIIHRCFVICRSVDCSIKYTITTAALETRSFESSLKFSVELPRESFYSIVVFPKLPLSQFILFILSSLSTWFGVSAIHFDPIKLIKRKIMTGRKKNTNSRCKRCLENRSEEDRIRSSICRLNILAQVLSKHLFVTQGADSERVHVGRLARRPLFRRNIQV